MPHQLGASISSTRGPGGIQFRTTSLRVVTDSILIWYCSVLLILGPNKKRWKQCFKIGATAALRPFSACGESPNSQAKLPLSERRSESMGVAGPGYDIASFQRATRIQPQKLSVTG